MTKDSPSPADWPVRDDAERHRFEIDLGGTSAFAEYTLPTGQIMFTHTKVPPEHGARASARH